LKKMKIDLGSDAITRRLKTVDELRKLCLSLADSSIGRKIREAHPDDPTVRRTSRAIGKPATPGTPEPPSVPEDEE
jgi:hypothetical protein